jgi:choline kinase
MKAIIIAAGSGKRMGKSYEAIPKSLTVVNGRTILERQVEILRQNGILNVLVITGANSEKFTNQDLKYIPDEFYEDHDILGSLMAAREYIRGDVIILYSDIIFEDAICKSVIVSDYDIGVAVDLDWRKSYDGRTMHPVTEAENVLLDGNHILEIRKGIESSNTVGEFLGIVRLSPKGALQWVQKYDELEKNHLGRFHQAPSIKKAYLTDMIQELIDSKIRVDPIFVSGKWCEIDTLQDLNRAETMFSI